MPRYEYECKECKTITVISKRIIDIDKTETCDTCKSELKRIISKNSFALKGGGWFADGY